MIGVHDRSYRDALVRAQQSVRIEIWRSGIQVEELTYTQQPRQGQVDRPVAGSPVFFGGSIRVTLQSRVCRSGSFTVPRWLYPWEPDDLLNPYGTEVRIYRGIRYGAGLTEFPVLVGPITSIGPVSSDTCTVNVADLAQRIVWAGFSFPTNSAAGSVTSAEFKRLIIGGYPDATFGTFDVTDQIIPTLAYGTDRGQALDDVANAAGAYWYPLAGGAFVLRAIPWTVPISTMPIPISDGYGGSYPIMTDGWPVRDSANVYSQITVTAEAADGSTPASAVAQDTDPASPTYIFGPFGIKAATVQLNAAGSQGATQNVAQTLLRHQKALTSAWTWTQIPDASMELGDPCALSRMRNQATQILSAFTMPLDDKSLMSCTGRDPQGEDLNA